MDYFAGQTGLFYDDELDGAMVSLSSGDLSLNLAYGRMYTWELKDADGSKPEMFIAQLTGSSSALKYDVEYYKVASDHSAEIWGAGLTYGVTDAIDIFGDFYQNTDASGDPTLWTAGLSYGHASMAKPGTFNIGVQYIDAEEGAYFGTTTYTASAVDALNGVGGTASEVKYWLASADVILAKNVRLHGEYAFDVDTSGTNVDYDDLATVSLNYVF